MGMPPPSTASQSASDEPETAPDGNNIFIKFIGFIVGFAVTAGIELALLSAVHGSPRGLGWVVLPFVAGSTLAGLAPNLLKNFSESGGSLWRAHTGIRLVGVLSGLWLVIVPCYWGLFVYSDDYAEMFKIMLFPVIILIVGYIAYTKLVAPAPRSSDRT